MTTLNLDNAIELIKNATDKATIEKITKSTLKMMNDRLNVSGKNKGLQISEKTFNNDKTDFIAKIKLIENVPDELKSEYKGHLNHHAISIAYEYKYQENDKKYKEIENNPKLPKKATTLDAQKLINLAVSWLESDDFYLIGIGVALLTGRRQSEIYFYTSFKADDENSMIVQYLSKKRENTGLKFRIPVLCNSDLIESAIEKMRKINPMIELLDIVNNSIDISKGLQVAREKFNDKYSSQIKAIYDRDARNYFQDCENIDLKNDKDHFHGIRATYASIFYHLSQEKYKCSVNDSINYVKNCLSHDTDGIAQKYTEFRFINLPSVDNFDDSIFSLDNICEIAIEKEDIKIQFSLSELMQKLDINSQNEFSKKLSTQDNIESILASFIIRGSHAMMVSQAVGKSDEIKKPDSRDKIGNIVLAIIKYNHNQELIENVNDRIYYGINGSAINSLAKFITGTSVDKKILKRTIDNLKSKIDECHNSLKMPEKLGTRKNQDGSFEVANYHLRGDQNKAKIDSVYQSILEIYESQFNL